MEILYARIVYKTEPIRQRISNLRLEVEGHSEKDEGPTLQVTEMSMSSAM